MAKVEQNIVIQGISGMLGGQVVFKRTKSGRTYISTRPTYPDGRVFSEAQKKHQGSFRDAVAYAKSAAKTEPIYTEMAKGEYHSAYNAAVADWFNPPEVAEIDLSGWAGQAGEPIRVKALDNIKVAQVVVLIVNEEGVVIEQGKAEQIDELWWIYRTTQAASGPAKVIAVAQDLPGNIGQGAKER
ncbi:MAG: hypothetical protein JXB07_13505 [Anaerolineae bacterium]|nr:hypothetical protein [Anaerolineae bacterium]